MTDTTLVTTNENVNQTTEHQNQTPSKVAPVMLRPAVDIVEAKDGYHLWAEMPGADESSVELSVERQLLTITGETDAFQPDGYELSFGHRRPRRYERSFRIPDEIARDGIEAEVKNGVLHVHLPKAQEALPQKITVKAGK